MTAKDAYRILKREAVKFDANVCVEYDNLFVFHAVENTLGVSLSVDKRTAKVDGFNPMTMPLEEFKRGKKVTDFK